MSTEPCPFCAIAHHQAPASIVYEDESLMAIIPIHPVYPGACLVIPRAHIDHFTDIPDPLAAQIMVVAQRIGRRIMEVYQPLRVGMVVHGFGVPHAHLHVLPQYDPLDIMHKHRAYVEDGKVRFHLKNIPELSRAELDEMAISLRL
ncbi:MAG: HIT family protein [Synechococcales bacterium]|nr:HIT family protein [Synechococcales bacterium]